MFFEILLQFGNKKEYNFFFVLYSLTKFFYLSYCVYAHDAFDITEPSSMQDAHHMHLSEPSYTPNSPQSLRYDSLWGLRIVCFCFAIDEIKNIFLYFITEIKKLPRINNFIILFIIYVNI